jgi:hypothetical protein
MTRNCRRSVPAIQWSNESQEWQLTGTFGQPAHGNACGRACGIMWLTLNQRPGSFAGPGICLGQSAFVAGCQTLCERQGQQARAEQGDANNRYG